MTYSIAIKLGSCNTSIFKQGEGIVLFEPSLVAYTGSGKDRDVKAVGSRAKRMQGRTDDQTFVMSPIFEGRITDVELACVMLKSFLNKVIKRGIIKPRIKAVVCIPIGLSLSERKTFEKVCYSVGIQDVVLVPSIICGAIGYNFPVSEPDGICLVNIGGGSTDIAVVSLNSIIQGVNIGVGGEVIDKAIEKHIANRFGIQIGHGVAEALKEEIGSLYKNDISKVEISGIDIETKMARDVVVESQDLYEVLENYYEKIIEAIKSILNECPPNIVQDVITKGVYLMGGTSLMTGVEQYFRRGLGLSVKIEDYTTAIDCLGAGKLLSDAKLLKELSEL